MAVHASIPQHERIWSRNCKVIFAQALSVISQPSEFAGIYNRPNAAVGRIRLEELPDNRHVSSIGLVDGNQLCQSLFKQFVLGLESVNFGKGLGQDLTEDPGVVRRQPGTPYQAVLDSPRSSILP